MPYRSSPTSLQHRCRHKLYIVAGYGALSLLQIGFWIAVGVLWGCHFARRWQQSLRAHHRA